MQWYAINTRPHQEKQAEFHVRQFGLETFLPLLKENRTIRRVPKTVVTPFLPGYFFAQFDIRSTIGLSAMPEEFARSWNSA